MVYELEDTSRVKGLFEGWQETLITSCLQKVMGRVFVTDLREPASAFAFVGCFGFFAGKPDWELVKSKPEGFTLLTPQDRQWAELIETTYPDAKKVTRYAIRKDTRFDVNSLKKNLLLLPSGWRRNWGISLTMNIQLMRSPKPFANLITGTRILCSVALLFCPAFSYSFFVLYLAAGFTDMIDGSVARKTGTVSEFGTKLDTATDFVFVAVCLWKLLPGLAVPLWLWIWIVFIALIKMINIISGYVIQKKYVTMHTIMNKVTGILLFILPLPLPVVKLKYSAPLVCTVATFAAIQEGYFIRKESNHD